jgi:CBS domain-containing protein
MSPRAAWRLERLGFGPVYDYTLGKVDWMAAGLPTVRADLSVRRVIDEVDREPPTCPPDAFVRDVGPSDRYVIVVNDDSIVLGRLAPTLEAANGDQRVEEVMEPGPTTVRAHEPLDAVRERMTKRNVREIIVTTPDGELLGVLRQ